MDKLLFDMQELLKRNASKARKKRFAKNISGSFMLTKLYTYVITNGYIL